MRVMTILSETDPADDGFAYFNLNNTDLTQNATQNLLSFFSTAQPLVVTFYETEIDALAETNAITNITNYRNLTQNTQIIWARIDSELNNDCFGIGPILSYMLFLYPKFDL